MTYLKNALDDLSTRPTIPFFNVDLANRESVAKSLGGVYVRLDVKYPTSTYYKYGPLQNHLWYDNLKALEAGTGTCTDQAAYLVGVLRAIGIPARMVGCKGTKGVTYDFKKNELEHTFTEVWYAGNWHFFEQTHLGKTNRLTGGIGSTFYAEQGVQFRPAGVGLHNKKYWVTTSNSAPGKDPINIYKWYNYNLDIVDLRFDKTSYKPGDTMNIEIDVKNTGEINIANPHLNVILLRTGSLTSLLWSIISWQNPIPCGPMTKHIHLRISEEFRDIASFLSILLMWTALRRLCSGSTVPSSNQTRVMKRYT
jgi:hypothetical protein